MTTKDRIRNKITGWLMDASLPYSVARKLAIRILGISELAVVNKDADRKIWNPQVHQPSPTDPNWYVEIPEGRVKETEERYI